MAYVCDPNLHHGGPCIRSTCIPSFDSRGEPGQTFIEALLTEYPQLSREDIQAAFLYATKASHNTLTT